MSKNLTVKHKCDHTCGHLHKSKKEFSDPVLQSLSKDLEQKYHTMSENMITEIMEFLGLPKEELKKGLGGHKYVKRTGAPGNYKYWYKLPNGQLVSGDDAPEGHPHHSSNDEVSNNKKKIITVSSKPISSKEDQYRKYDWHKDEKGHHVIITDKKTGTSSKMKYESSDHSLKNTPNIMTSYHSYRDENGKKSTFAGDAAAPIEESGKPNNFKIKPDVKTLTAATAPQEIKQALNYWVNDGYAFIRNYQKHGDANFGKEIEYSSNHYDPSIYNAKGDELDEYKDEAKSALKTLDKYYDSLPKYENKPITRGMLIEDKPKLEKFLSTMKPGDTFIPDTYLSFSKGDDLHNDFHDSNIQIVVDKNKSGKDITSLVEMQEDEVLVKNGTNYRVVKTDFKAGINFGGGTHIIHLEEITPVPKGKILAKPTQKKTVIAKQPKKPKVVLKKDGGGLKNKGADYKPISKTNLVGSVQFSNVDKATAEHLKKALNGAETVIAKMGIVSKTPITFFTAGTTDRTENAMYHPDGNKIEFVKPSPDAATIMHEIGHAIDLAMSPGEDYNFNEFYDALKNEQIDKEDFTPAQNIMYQIIKEAKSSPYYKESSGKFRDYLNDPTEIFARAFEVHSYKVANDLVQQGKLDQEFMYKFMPDLDRVGKFTNTEEWNKMNAQNEEMNKQILNAIVKKDKPTEKKLREEQYQHKLNMEAVKNSMESGGRGDASINKISGLVDALLKLEPIKKSK